MFYVYENHCFGIFRKTRFTRSGISDWSWKEYLQGVTWRNSRNSGMCIPGMKLKKPWSGLVAWIKKPWFSCQNPIRSHWTISNASHKNSNTLFFLPSLLIKKSFSPSLVRFVKADLSRIKMVRIIVLPCPDIHLFMLRVRRILQYFKHTIIPTHAQQSSGGQASAPLMQTGYFNDFSLYVY